MRDCWLDPYGNVYYVEPFAHNDFAQEQLKDEFPMENKTTPLREGPLGIDTWDERGFCGSFEETLMRRGWIRYSTATNQWCYGRDWGGWERYPRPTSAQRDRMFDLTGEIDE